MGPSEVSQRPPELLAEKFRPFVLDLVGLLPPCRSQGAACFSSNLVPDRELQALLVGGDHSRSPQGTQETCEGLHGPPPGPSQGLSTAVPHRKTAQCLGTDHGRQAGSATSIYWIQARNAAKSPPVKGQSTEAAFVPKCQHLLVPSKEPSTLVKSPPVKL